MNISKTGRHTISITVSIRTVLVEKFYGDRVVLYFIFLLHAYTLWFTKLFYRMAHITPSL